MVFVTTKVLFFRYLYVLRQRWLLTIAYLLLPILLCVFALMLYDSLELKRFESFIIEHDERSLLRLPETEQCALEGHDLCQLKIVVCPSGRKEHQLMNRVMEILRFSSNATALNVEYVDHADHVQRTLVSSEGNNSRGILFHEISETRLEYTMRPRMEYISPMLYDWGDYATDQRFPSPMNRGPRLTDPYFNIEDGGKILTGLLPLQVAIDKAYFEMYFPNISNEWILTSFPYPPYYELNVGERFHPTVTHRAVLIVVQYTLIIGMLFMSMVFASSIIHDKESGIREWLCMYGAPRLMVNISWLILFCCEATILALLEAVILKLPTENGPTIKYMSAFVLCLVLIIYNLMTLCWVYLFASFFNNQVLCVLIIAAYWLFSPLFQLIPNDHFLLQGVLAVLPNAGIVLIFMSFQEFDGAEFMLGIRRLHLQPIHFLPVGILVLIMLVTSVLLVLLGMYVDLVKPGKYGKSKPWYLFSKRKKMESDDGNETPLPSEGRFFEGISSKDGIALECVNITKFFKKHRVVDNVNMKVLRNKITVIVGLNGAGKTTLLCMLCGLYSPTSGHFYTQDYNVFQGNNIKKFRKIMGYCPQHNMLMSELTVKQHFMIFALLKGMSKTEAEEYCIDWSIRFHMENVLNTKASELSEGAKRKLCLAIAMIGDPHYLLLDEPSSHLDFESTRTFWNLLLQQKDQCTVILTTHDMDEAEILGDRIVIMSGGQLKGYGTSSFLKKQLRIAYKLTCTVTEEYQLKVIKVVKTFNPSTTILHQTNHTVTFGFPVGKLDDLSSLVGNLEDEFGDKLTISLSYASMEDVLMKLEPAYASTTASLGGSQKPPTDYLDLLKIPETGKSLWSCGMMKEILMKKMKWTSNHLFLITIFLIILPILGSALTMHLTSQAIGQGHSTGHDINLTMATYSGARPLIVRRKDAITKALRTAVKDSGLKYEEYYEDMVDVLDQKAKKNMFIYRSRYVFGFDSGEKITSSSTAYYSRNALHSAPIAYSTLMNAILPGNANIVTHNHPVVGGRKGPSCSNLMNPDIVNLLFVIFLGPALLITCSYFVILPLVEKRNLFKHLQLMTGLLPCFYWLSHLMVDFLSYSMSVLFIIAIVAVMDFGLFLNVSVMMALIIVLLLYGISVIIFAYAWSFWACSISTILIGFVAIHPVLLIGFSTLKSILAGLYVLEYKYLYFLPWITLMESLQKIATWAVEKKACSMCKDEGSCESILPNENFPSLDTEILSFVVVSLMYFVFIVSMDHGFGRKLKPIFDRARYRGINDHDDDIDPDVALEKKNVKDLEVEEEEYRSDLICDGLGKKYSRKVTAVRDVTFAADRGEIFGLLGANGAGKSTTFGMLAGWISPTKGLATAMGKWELSDCEYKYIRNIGYCPQYRGYLSGLTGRDTLHLFGRLRGFKPPALDIQVDLWLRALDMVSIADKPCEVYSRGSKRKLRFAIAMIGCPPVVLLDEPTTSIDPVIRWRIRDILMTSLKQRNQAIVLTSHTMSECEAICDRLTIMVDGEMKCLGSVTQLKNNFGNICILLVKLRSNTNKRQLRAIQSRILKESQFSEYAQLKEEQPNLLTINVATEEIKTYDVFAEMLMIKEENSAIEDFEVTEKPLEEVFMKFALENQSKETPSDRKRRVQGRP